jgi:hypothetical protein
LPITGITFQITVITDISLFMKTPKELLEELKASREKLDALRRFL